MAILTSARTWRGSGVSLAKIALGLSERGHQVHMLVGEDQVARNFAELGLPVSLTPTGNTGLREISDLRRTLRRIGADAVMADRLRDLRLAGWATVSTPSALVYRHNVNGIGPQLRLTDWLVLRRAGFCLFQANRVRDEAIARAPWLGRLPGRVVYNGYDTHRFAANAEAGALFRARYGLAPDRLLALTTSTLEPSKGHAVALDALARARTAGHPATYLVIGEGPLAKDLESHAERAGVPTILTGFLGPEDLIAALSAADLYLHPSLEEIFPNAVGEAMSCGRAVVASDVGGTVELLGADGRTGVLTPPGDVAALAAAIIRLASDSHLRQRLGAAGRERIEREFPLSRMVERYESIVLEAAGPRRARK